MLIAFSGKRGVGKTTAARYLVSSHGFINVSFADRLKDISKKLFPFTNDELHGNGKEQKFEKYDWTPRDFMIKFGQFMRYAKAGLSLLKMSLIPESKLKDSWGLRNRLKGQMSVASS